VAEDEKKEDRLTVVAVPDEQAQAVIEFVASLDSDDADVSGHMLSRGTIGGTGGPLAAKGRSLTACWQTGTTDYPDWSCSDTDI
jgi:hypothetical protein